VKKISVNTSKLLADAPKKNAQGYVVFEEVESVDKALEMNNTPVPGSDGLMFRVDAANPTHDSTRSVFVGNLPYKTDEMSLRDHFKSGCGFEDDVIENVRVIRDSETSQCKGFGYILLKDKSYLPYVLDMHESTYKKKELRVMVCGKRFKGRRGAKKEKKEVDGAMKRIKDKYKKTTAESLAGNKEKRKRGTKKVGARKATGQAGISKRAATDKKVDKRVKKIQKRLTTGMGKGKK
jgi:nucleolar protein 12